MINLDRRHFSPISNSVGGRVKNDAVFIYQQSGKHFTARYSGQGISDGHIIGKMTGPMTATLIYHSRAAGGSLEAGEANVSFGHSADEMLTMSMDWTWLNGTKQSGRSQYIEIKAEQDGT